MTIERCTRRQLLSLTGSAGLAVLGIPTAAQAAANYAQKVLALKPVAYWRLGEAKGPLAVDCGGLDEEAIYPRVLTAAEILDHYNNGVKA